MWRKSVGLICLLSLLLCGMAHAESGFLNWLGIRGSIYYGDFWYSASEFESSYYQITQYRYKDGTVDFFKGDLGEGNLSFAERMETDENPFRKLFDDWRIEVSEPTSVAGFEAERVALSSSDLQGEVLIIHTGTRDIYCGYSGEEEDCRRFVPEFNRILSELSIFEPVNGLEWTGGERTVPNFQVRNVEFGTEFLAGRARNRGCLLDMPDSLECDFISIHCSQLKNGEEVQFSPEISFHMDTPTIIIRPYQSVGMSYVEMIVDDGYTSWDLAEYFQEVDLYDKESVVLRSDLYYQIAALDLDGDYDNELIALAGDGRTELEIIVFKYSDGIFWPLYRSVGTGVAYLREDDLSTIYVEGLRDGTEAPSDPRQEALETGIQRDEMLVPRSRRILKGYTVNLRVKHTDGSELDQPEYVYTSSDPSVAQVDSNGIVTGISEGTAIVTARLPGSDAVRLSYQIDVVDREPRYQAVIMANGHFTPEDEAGPYFLQGAESFEKFLQYTQYDAVYSLKDFTRDEGLKFLDEISYLNEARDLTENDYTLVYIATHGTENKGFYTTDGYNDFPYITYQELKEGLDNINGKIILFVDSCYSGGIIERSENYEEFASKSQKQFLADFGNDTMDTEKYYIITAATNSTLCRGGEFGFDLIKYLMVAVGFDVSERDFTQAYCQEYIMDGEVSFIECINAIIDFKALVDQVSIEKHEKMEPEYFQMWSANDADIPVFYFNDEAMEQLGLKEKVNLTTPESFPLGLGNLPGNLANGGFAAAGDGMSFYADGSALWRIGNDSESAVKLADGSFDCLNYLDGYVYAVMEYSDFRPCYGYSWNVHDFQGDPSEFEEAFSYDDTCAVRVPVRIPANGAGILQLLGPEQAENYNGISEYRCMTVANGYIYYVGGNETPFSYQLYGYNYILDDYGMCNYESRRGNSVYRMRLDGSDVIELIPNIGNSMPELSSNGEKIYVRKSLEILLDGVPGFIQAYDMQGNLLWEQACLGNDIGYSELGLMATDQGAITVLEDYGADNTCYLCWYSDSTDGLEREMLSECVWPFTPAIICNGMLYTYYSLDDDPYSDDGYLYNPHNIAILRSSQDNPGVKEPVCRGTFFYTEWKSYQDIYMSILEDWLYISFLKYDDTTDRIGNCYRYNMMTGESQTLSDGVARQETLANFFGYTME